MRVMVSHVVLTLWFLAVADPGRGEVIPRPVVLSWFRERVLDLLGLDQPPEVVRGPLRAHRVSRAVRVTPPVPPSPDLSEVTLFPTSDSSCFGANSSQTQRDHLTFHFQSSINVQNTSITSAQFWFYAGDSTPTNASMPVSILPSAGLPLPLPLQAPSAWSSDGWTTYHLDQNLITTIVEGPFQLLVHCSECPCLGQNKTPFLHLKVVARGWVSPEPPPIPWSPSVVYLLQRPSQERPVGDCERAQVDVSFQELGWEKWIVHPKALTFYYCHGNCSSKERSASVLGIVQCCAPVPGAMRSLKITTTSDGGLSYTCETLPNIMPEQCACF